MQGFLLKFYTIRDLNLGISMNLKSASLSANITEDSAFEVIRPAKHFLVCRIVVELKVLHFPVVDI